jgi:hypothetical protein
MILPTLRDGARAAETPMAQLSEQPSRPTWIELESAIPPDRVEKITGLSWDSIKRHYRDKIVKLSPKRRGMKLRNALIIAAGRNETAA